MGRVQKYRAVRVFAPPTVHTFLCFSKISIMAQGDICTNGCFNGIFAGPKYRIIIATFAGIDSFFLLCFFFLELVATGRMGEASTSVAEAVTFTITLVYLVDVVIQSCILNGATARCSCCMGCRHFLTIKLVLDAFLLLTELLDLFVSLAANGRVSRVALRLLAVLTFAKFGMEIGLICILCGRCGCTPPAASVDSFQPPVVVGQAIEVIEAKNKADSN